MFQMKTCAQWHAIPLLLFVIVAAPIASGQPLDAIDKSALCELPEVLSSESLVQLALQCSPAQKAISARWQAKRHLADVADSLEDPKLMFGAAPQTFGQDGLDNGYIVEINQPLPWPGVLSLRKQAADAQAGVWQARYSQTQVILARDVRLRYTQWQYHRQLLAINRQHQQLWREFIAIVRAKYASGTTGKSAVLQATHEHHGLMQASIELSAAINRDASQLKKLVNLPAAMNLNNLEVSSEKSTFIPAAGISTLLARLDRQPAMKALDAARRQKSHELALAEKDRYPNFTLMTRYNSLWANDEQRWVVGVGFNMPLDFGKRSSRESSVKAERNALRWEQQDLRVQLREQLVQAHSYWQQAQDVYQLYQQDLLPLAEENLATASSEYQSGAGDFLTLLTAQRQLLATQRKSETSARDQLSHSARFTAAAGLVHLRDSNSLGDSNE